MLIAAGSTNTRSSYFFSSTLVCDKLVFPMVISQTQSIPPPEHWGRGGGLKPLPPPQPVTKKPDHRISSSVFCQSIDEHDIYVLFINFNIHNPYMYLKQFSLCVKVITEIRRCFICKCILFIHMCSLYNLHKERGGSNKFRFFRNLGSETFFF